MAGGMLRVLRPTSSGSPCSFSSTLIRLASQERRRAVSTGIAGRMRTQSLGIDVHYDLKAVGSARRCIGLREEALGHRGQRIGAPRRVWDWPFLGELGRDLILRKGFERSVQRL